MISGKVISDEEGVRLDNFLQEKLALTRSRIKALIDNGDILLDGRKVKAGILIKIGQEISYSYEEEKPLDAAPEKVDFEIVYEDSDLLVINKPQGLVVHPCSSTRSGTLVNGLLYSVKDLSGINGVLRPGIVHRLDKNTSGLMLVAKNDFTHKELASQIASKTECKRLYLALCSGHFKDESGTIETFIDRDKKDRKKMAVQPSGRKAITHYRVIKSFKNCELVEFSLETGRTHQIRVHSKYLNHPIIGDDVYGQAVKGLNGQLLHSYKLSFTHPRTGEKKSFEIALPKHFADYIAKL